MKQILVIFLYPQEVKNKYKKSVRMSNVSSLTVLNGTSAGQQQPRKKFNELPFRSVRN
jgi:hypothetical protein